MNLWHLTLDAPRSPLRVSPGERVWLNIGTWPIEPGQAVWVEYWINQQPPYRVDALWQRNEGANSYWQAELGPFAKGQEVRYRIMGAFSQEQVEGPEGGFKVGPKLYLALLWHQHQPLYKDPSKTQPRGSYLHPWVRLHAIRDYYPMADLVAQHPAVHLTVNLTPVLLWQLEDYLERGATDQAQELTRRPAEDLSGEERKYLLSHFFDADWHHQIYPHPRFKELFEQRAAGKPFGPQDYRDLQMWFNLSWFGLEFRQGEVRLVTGETASVRRWVEQDRGFAQEDLEAMLGEQYKILRAVIPLHRRLQDQGQIEVSTTPFYHPILPLLLDSDQATLDRPGGTLPTRFAYPQDAQAQVERAVACYTRHFGRPPKGMWPAEGAVSQGVIPFFAQQGLGWIATDQGVLARSGQYGYNTADPEVLTQPYRAEQDGKSLSVFFRDTALSDNIGFRYQGCKDFVPVARAFLDEIKGRFAYRLQSDEDRVLSVILDGENAWGAYCEDARPFLHALYRQLAQDSEIEAVTFSEYLQGNPVRGIPPHPTQGQTKVYDLFTGSWIDENGSSRGVDLGTWIGEAEENRAWELLKEAREAVQRAGATPETHPAAFEAVYTAEGSDWFWWFGEDQDSGNDAEFDELFRTHLQNVYRGLGQEPPDQLKHYLVRHSVVWTFANPVQALQLGDALTVQTNCPGRLTWWREGRQAQSAELAPVGGVMAGTRRYRFTLGPLEGGTLFFRFRCTQPDCDHQSLTCKEGLQTVGVI
ncbi:MAG: hypothetical protein K6T57_05725 [Thermaceae bacterium]|nr:hypothetical protein [Thermaceae bacterium]